MSTQQYISELIEQDLHPERFPRLSEAQLERIRDSVQELESTIEDITDVLKEAHVQVEGGMELTMWQ